MAQLDPKQTISGENSMIIQVNDKYRISSTATCWQVEKYKGKRKDTGKDKWEPITHHVDFKSALVSFAEYRIRSIADYSTVDEIKSTIRQIRDECLSAADVFRELVV